MEDCLLICLALPPPGKGLHNFMEHYLTKESSLLDMYMSCQSQDNATAWVCSIHNRSMKCWARFMTQDWLFFPRQIKHYHPTSTYGTQALKKEEKKVFGTTWTSETERRLTPMSPAYSLSCITKQTAQGNPSKPAIRHWMGKTTTSYFGITRSIILPCNSVLRIFRMSPNNVKLNTSVLTGSANDVRKIKEEPAIGIVGISWSRWTVRSVFFYIQLCHINHIRG